MPIILDGNLGAGYMGAGASLAGQRNAMQNENMQRAFQTGIGLYQSQMEREDRKKQLAQQQENWNKSFDFNKEQADQKEAWRTYKTTQYELERDRLIRRDSSDRGYLASMLGKPELANTDVSPDVLRRQVEITAQQQGIYDEHVKEAMFDKAQKQQQDEKAANGVAGMVSSMAENGLVQPEEADAIFKLLREDPGQANTVAQGVQQRFQVQWAKQRQKMERSEQANSMRSFTQTATWLDPTKRKKLEMMADGVEAGVFTADDFAREIAGQTGGYTPEQIGAMVQSGALTPKAGAQLGSMGGDKIAAREFMRNSQETPQTAKFNPDDDPDVATAVADQTAAYKAYEEVRKNTASTPEQIAEARNAHQEAVKKATSIRNQRKTDYYTTNAIRVFQQKNGRNPDLNSDADVSEIDKIASELEGSGGRK